MLSMVQRLNKAHLRLCYKLFGVLNFISSILAIFFVKAELWEKVFSFIGVNLIFIMFYEFYNSLINHKGKGNLAWPIFGEPMKLVFGLFSIIGSFLILYVLTKIIVQYDEKELFFLVCLPASLFLGGTSLLISLKEQN